MNGTGKQPQRPPAPVGIFKPEAIRDIAEGMGISTLPEGVASALASDVEYRIHQIVEEAVRFMRHARRTTLTTGDIDQALRVLNIEPLYGHTSHSHPPFRRANVMVPGQAAVYFVEDTEIDFDKVLHEEKVFLPKPVSWKAHWLAVEGVQPMIPENPPQARNEAGKTASPAPAATTRTTKTGTAANKKQAARHVLSRELQLYYNRLTASLLPQGSDSTKRAAALASLRNDAGLQALLPYLVRWVGERVVHALKTNPGADADGKVLEIMLEVLAALLDNPALFVEPYLHQMLPPVLSALLTASLPQERSSKLRKTAAQIVSRLLTAHSTTYPSLSPRLTKTLLVALLAQGKTSGTREGAVRGLTGIGKEAVRMGLISAGGLQLLSSEPPDSPVVSAVLDALRALYPPGTTPQPPPLTAADAMLLRQTCGDAVANALLRDTEWASGVAAQIREPDDQPSGSLASSGALESTQAALTMLENMDMEAVAASMGVDVPDDFEMVDSMDATMEQVA
ncbi:TAF-domain-containing protein [Exidia glandulosa HHB12029]|uniref:TBP-associated factor 6 n=1 Tax=Exidia glandulosa HHB12029 TaxID=1314781 RepID=A0A165FCS3_EXIGL|nr:TAF-domain-containing protein [Exidia glandulosa HHB12029]